MLSCTAASRHSKPTVPEQLTPYGMRLLRNQWNISGIQDIYGYTNIHQGALVDAVIVGHLLADELPDAYPLSSGKYAIPWRTHNTFVFCVKDLEHAILQIPKDDFKHASLAARSRIAQQGIPALFQKRKHIVEDTRCQTRCAQRQDDPDLSKRALHLWPITLYDTLPLDWRKHAPQVVSFLQYLQDEGVDRSVQPLIVKAGTDKGYFEHQWTGHNDMALERRYARFLAQKVANQGLRRGVSVFVDYEGTRFIPKRKEGDPEIPTHPEIILNFELINREGNSHEGLFDDIVAPTRLDISVTQGLGVTPA